jgi:hypothetical protein
MAFVDALDLREPATVACDLCVIGAGAAGMALARQFLGTRWRVALIESGGFGMEMGPQALNSGAIQGEGLPGDYLTTTRLRMFGGTTMAWMGYCRPLDAYDFEAKPWIPDYPAWPFPREELVPYYDRAAALAQVPPFFRVGPEQKNLKGDRVQVVSLPFGISPIRFGTAFREEFQLSANISVYLHATGGELVPTAGGGHVERLRVVSGDGRDFSIEARRFVVCGGGIETVRLLLNSDRVVPGGIGNAHDLLGRYFMSHFPIPAFSQILLAGQRINDLVRSLLQPEIHYLALRDEVKRRRRLLNAGFQFNPGFGDAAPGRHPGSMREVYPAVELALRGPTEFAQLPGIAVQEQAPNRECRIALSSERDRSGMRKVELRFRRSPADMESLRASVALLARELGRHDLGRLQTVFAGDALPPLQPDDHHMGATRMHEDPKRGVVDAAGRVHGTDNLFVAGSSVFPSAGFANPTLTIIALALRLADHLKGLGP